MTTRPRLARLSLVTLGFTACFSLAGCGGGTEAPTQTPTAPPSGSTEVELTAEDASAVENEGAIDFTVKLSAPSNVLVSVDFATLDGTATGTGDYQPSNGELRFQPGETHKTVSVTVVNDTAIEGSENLHLVLSNPRNASLAKNTGVGIIIDDDAMETTAEFDPNWATVGVFSSAQSCTGCHRASTDQDPAIATVMRYPLQDDGEDISPGNQWQHSMMAHAFNDPYYQATVQDETHAFPKLAGFIEDKCLTCHSPMARTHAHQTGMSLTQDESCGLSDGCYRFDTARLDMHAREGVSCTLCHQIKEDNLGSEASFSGLYTVAKSDEPGARTIFGPYQNPHAGGANAMQANSGYTPQFGGQMASSGHCASCHTLYTPTLDAVSGTPTGNAFLEQGAFLEWKNSIYGSGTAQDRQCQDCHMAAPDAGSYATRIAVKPDGSVNAVWPERAPFFSHSMLGGNAYVLELLRDYRALLGIENSTSTAGFDEKIAQTRALLQNQTAALDITRVSAEDDELNVDVRVTNRTGHKLPTGFPSRRVWIHFRVKDASDRVVFESGAPDAAGRISTDAQRLDPDCLAHDKSPDFDNENCFEPHRDVIAKPSQVAIYEAVPGDTLGHITHVLLHASSYLKDNRLPPRGFTNSAASAIEIQTVPAGVNGDNDFNASNGQEGSGTDTVHYRVHLDGDSGPYTVEARLLYQAIQPSFVEALHADADRVNRFKVMYARHTPRVETLAEASAAY